MRPESLPRTGRACHHAPANCTVGATWSIAGPSRSTAGRGLTRRRGRFDLGIPAILSRVSAQQGSRLQLPAVRVVIARCSVDYEGALQAHLPLATRLLMVKADGSVLVHSDGGSYKPLNWMAPPCRMSEVEPSESEAIEGVISVWLVQHGKRDDTLRICIHEVLSDTAHDLGIDPGLVKSGVEAQLQELLAQHISTLGQGYRLLRREFPTAIGPVDILCKDDQEQTVAVEIKRRGDIDGVEQLTRYLELLNRDPHISPVVGVFAAQLIRPQARTLATDRGIRCVTLDYDALRGLDDATERLF
ncbi:endonuclease NucS [soil metagenome]